MTAGGTILVGGEALMDLVSDGEVLHPRPGGGPFTTARTVARLGQPAAFLGRLSTDPYGVEHADLLRADGVSTRTAARTTDPTTLALATVGDDGAADYRFYTQGTAAAGLTPEQALDALPTDVAILHVGTLGLVLEPLATALEAVVDALAGKALVVVDPNCRPAAIADPAAYRQRLQGIIARADLVKASEEDLAYLTPGRRPRALLDRGPRAVVVTQGRHGATVLTRTREQHVPAASVRVVDTIGAGDVFGGALVAWWRAQGLTAAELGDPAALVQATRFATTAAGLSLTRPGAQPPRRDEMPD